jgi:hypothetical protein
MALTPYYTKAESDALDKQVLESSANGIISSIDTSSAIPTQDGLYPCTESGTYTNFGGEIVSLDNQVVSILVENNQATFTQLVSELIIPMDSVPTSGSLNAVQSGGVIEAIDKIASETDIIKINGIIDGSRPNVSGDIISSANHFRSLVATPVVVGKRYAVISSNTGEDVTFAFYNSPTIESASFISSASGQSTIVPSGATHMMFFSVLSIKSTLIIQQLDSGFPTLGMETFLYSDVYTRSETYTKSDLYTRSETYTKTESNSLIDNKLNVVDFLNESNYLKNPNLIVNDGFRADNAGNIIPDNTAFLIREIDVEEGDRFSSVSDDVSIFPRFSCYNSSSVFDGTTAIGTTTYLSREFVVPANAKKLFVSQKLTLKDTFILMKLKSGDPVLGQNTTDFKSNEIIPDFYGKETNILKQQNTLIIPKKRTTNGGLIFTDNSFFMLNFYPVIEGERYACVSDTGNPTYTARFSFYSKKSDAVESFISLSLANEVTAPAGAKWMIFAGDINTQETFILKQLDSGFPELKERTVELKDTYDKEYLDENFDKSKWYPEVFDIPITYVQRNEIVLAIKDDILYGTNSGRNVFKATQTDLSDLITLCTLDSNSSLRNLTFISDTKAVGYVRNVINLALEGFYVFENVNTGTWTFRKTGVMISGYPKMEFQSLILADNGYIFSCSYSDPDKKDSVANPINPPPVHIYRSIDSGESWQIVYTHYTTLNIHMHAIEFDPYRQRVICLIGDENSGGQPGWAYSDDYGANWTLVENNEASGQTSFMDTALIPTRKGLIVGSDYHPAGIREWTPKNDVKNAPILASEVTDAYLIPYKTDNNFAFASKPIVDLSTYPYKVCVPFAHNESYSKAVLLISPNFKDWYMLNLIEDPQNTPSFSFLSGITSDGTVVGSCRLTGVTYYLTFKFPKWIKN